MNSAISKLEVYYSRIVKLLLFFYSPMSPNKCGNYFFFLFFNQLFPLSSLLSHLWNSLSCLPSSLPLHSRSFPLSSSIYSANLKSLPCCWSRLGLPISSGAVSPRVSLPRAADLSFLHLAFLSFSLFLVLVAMFVIVVGWFWLLLVGWFWLVVMSL